MIYDRILERQKLSTQKNIKNSSASKTSNNIQLAGRDTAI